MEELVRLVSVECWHLVRLEIFAQQKRRLPHQLIGCLMIGLVNNDSWNHGAFHRGSLNLPYRRPLRGYLVTECLSCFYFHLSYQQIAWKKPYRIILFPRLLGIPSVDSSSRISPPIPVTARHGHRYPRPRALRNQAEMLFNHTDLTSKLKWSYCLLCYYHYSAEKLSPSIRQLLR